MNNEQLVEVKSGSSLLWQDCMCYLHHARIKQRQLIALYRAIGMLHGVIHNLLCIVIHV